MKNYSSFLFTENSNPNTASEALKHIRTGFKFEQVTLLSSEPLSKPGIIFSCEAGSDEELHEDFNKLTDFYDEGEKDGVSCGHYVFPCNMVRNALNNGLKVVLSFSEKTKQNEIAKKTQDLLSSVARTINDDTGILKNNSDGTVDLIIFFCSSNFATEISDYKFAISKGKTEINSNCLQKTEKMFPGHIIVAEYINYYDVNGMWGGILW